MKNRRIVKKTIAAVLAAAVCMTAAAPAAKAETPSAKERVMSAAMKGAGVAYSGTNSSYETFNYMTEEGLDALKESAESLPEKFDLRDQGLVTPVKFQNPYPYCWAFGTVAAAESGILSALGTTYEETQLDLSELHTVYFAYRHLPENSDSPQAKEGFYNPYWEFDTSALGEYGGMCFTTVSLFASGIGPVFESDAPYHGKNEYCDDYCYSYFDDWTLSEKLRFKHEYDLIEGNMLPAPANWVRDKYGNPQYVYNEAGTLAIKSELFRGKAVAIGFHADQSMPNTPIEDAKYLNVFGDEPKWAHYTNEPILPDHAVTIVGWDDTYPKENFLAEPEGDGAWIVKNSWGSGEEEFPNNGGGDWGILNEEGINTGYFYLSYYDQTLCVDEAPITFTMGNTDTDQIYQHDLMPVKNMRWSLHNDRLMMANVFTAEADQEIMAAGIYTAHPDTAVNIKVYELLDGATEPDEGLLIAEADQNIAYAGFHRVDLENAPLVRKGKRFSVVVTDRVETETGVKYLRFQNLEISESAFDPDWYMLYAKGIVNPGESFEYTDRSGKWTDLSQIVSEYKAEEDDWYDYDNFNIKAYAKTVSPTQQEESLNPADGKESKADASGKDLASGSKEGKSGAKENAADSTKQEKPAKVAGIRIKKSAGTQKVLTWKKAGADVLYQVYFAASKNGKYKKLAETNKNTYSLKAGKKLKNGKKYYFKVRAVRKTAGSSDAGSFSKTVAGRVKA